MKWKRTPVRVLAQIATFGLALAVAQPFAGVALAQGPNADLNGAAERAFEGRDACVVLRDFAPGVEPATSDVALCGRRLPPCATFEIAATAVALDRGIAPNVDAPIRLEPPMKGDPPQGLNLRESLRRPAPYVFEEVARRIGPESLGRALAALRYGNAAISVPAERSWLGETDDGLALSAVEQVDFMARLKRGELPIATEAQFRTVEIIPYQRTREGGVAWKSGACGGGPRPMTAWAVGWVDRGPRTTVFAAVETSIAGATVEDVTARTRRLLAELGLLQPQPPQE